MNGPKSPLMVVGEVRVEGLNRKVCQLVSVTPGFTGCFPNYMFSPEAPVKPRYFLRFLPHLGVWSRACRRPRASVHRAHSGHAHRTPGSLPQRPVYGRPGTLARPRCWCPRRHGNGRRGRLLWMERRGGMCLGGVYSILGRPSITVGIPSEAAPQSFHPGARHTWRVSRDVTL
ncbi:unnamed protein product [Lota lota]